MAIKHGNQRYPWAAWLDGQEHTAEQGKDFQSSIPQFQNLLHVTAKRRGYRVRSGSDGTVVTFRFEKEAPTEGEGVKDATA